MACATVRLMHRKMQSLANHLCSIQLRKTIPVMLHTANHQLLPILYSPTLENQAEPARFPIDFLGKIEISNFLKTKLDVSDFCLYNGFCF